MVYAIKTIEELSGLEEAWNELYWNCQYVTPFQSFAFQFSSWNHYKSTGCLHIIVTRNDSNKQIQAIIPSLIDNHGILRFINSSHTDFCGLLIRNECVKYSLFKEIANYLISEKSIKGIQFDNLRQSDCCLSVLKPFFKFHQIVDCNYYSSVKITNNPEDVDFIDCLRDLKSSKKKQLRQLYKGLINPKFLLLKQKQNDTYPEKDINYLVNQMIRSGKRKSEYFSDSMLAFWRELYKRNVLSIGMYFENEELRSINFIYHDSNNNQYIKWIMLYLDNADNLKLNLHFIHYLYQNSNDEIINFARGIYDYKMEKFHPTVYPLFSLYISKTKITYIKNSIDINVRYLKEFVKSIIRK